MAGNYARPQMRQTTQQSKPAAAPARGATTASEGPKRESDYKLCVEVDGQMVTKEGTENVWQWFGNGYVNKDGSIGIRIGSQGLPDGQITKFVLVKPKTKSE